MPIIIWFCISNHNSYFKAGKMNSMLFPTAWSFFPVTIFPLYQPHPFECFKLSFMCEIYTPCTMIWSRCQVILLIPRFALGIIVTCLSIHGLWTHLMYLFQNLSCSWRMQFMFDSIRRNACINTSDSRNFNPKFLKNFPNFKPCICTYNNRTWHTIETCYKKHGLPPHS